MRGSLGAICVKRASVALDLWMGEDRTDSGLIIIKEEDRKAAE